MRFISNDTLTTAVSIVMGVPPRILLDRGRIELSANKKQY